MEHFEKINSHRYLFLADIREPDDNELRLVIEEGKLQDPPQDLEIAGHVFKGARSVLPTDDSALYEIYFEDYIAYSVLNESYGKSNDFEDYEGNLFRIYLKSHFLDYIGKNSYALQFCSGPFQHYQLVCCNHVLDVVSMGEPVVKQTRGA